MRRGNEAVLQQSSVLTDQINKLVGTAEKLNTEKVRLDADVAAIDAETAKLRAQAFAALRDITLPSTCKVDAGNGDASEVDLTALASAMTNPTTPEAFKKTVRDALKTLDAAR